MKCEVVRCEVCESLTPVTYMIRAQSSAPRETSVNTDHVSCRALGIVTGGEGARCDSSDPCTCPTLPFFIDAFTNIWTSLPCASKHLFTVSSLSGRTSTLSFCGCSYEAVIKVSMLFGFANATLSRNSHIKLAGNVSIDQNSPLPISDDTSHPTPTPQALHVYLNSHSLTPHNLTPHTSHLTTSHLTPHNLTPHTSQPHTSQPHNLTPYALAMLQLVEMELIWSSGYTPSQQPQMGSEFHQLLDQQALSVPNLPPNQGSNEGGTFAQKRPGFGLFPGCLPALNAPDSPPYEGSNEGAQAVAWRRPARNRRVPCDVCGEWVTKAALTRHKMSRHSEYRPHDCHYCQKSFLRKDLRDRHVKSVHQDSFITTPTATVTPATPAVYLHGNGGIPEQNQRSSPIDLTIVSLALLPVLSGLERSL
ncbi:uncharacterized protein BDR25DRAFT_396936 [Lindgomyces ingoldianus]|uniref:Uncharacterized protein n=1 Tax=Lindgomyces ingoldianus TaxID=673940 RepID=A0ACB6QAF1_9PLEO|nr:uncharacterized protein BDR25DRAFT_396936 [Lindgomyces ingoldianus]KAF2463939.1 hypothetical protein BDR25DRAFT_396936 [Lindgomyces ingoldianus]